MRLPRRAVDRTPEHPSGPPPTPPLPRPLVELQRAAGNAALARRVEAARDVGAHPLPDGLRNEMEGLFGEPFGDVRVRRAATGSALALTAGANIDVSGRAPAADSPEGRFLVAHELAHVVQQRGSPSASQDLPRRLVDARLEDQADAAGRAAAAGRPVEAGSLTRAQSSAPVVQAFDEDEHDKLGSLGSQGSHGETRMVELAPGYRVTFGEMVSMGGDHFESIDEVRRLAAVDGTGAGTREEVEYVRVVKIDGRDADKSKFSDEARKAADQRFNRLAAANETHFPFPGRGDSERSLADQAADNTTFDRVKYPLEPVALPDESGVCDPAVTSERVEWIFGAPEFVEEVEVPRNAIAAYHLGHGKALLEAAAAGRGGVSIDQAAAAEAFADHFLTDSFSGGHVATERRSIVDYWDPKVPMFSYNLQGYLAEEVAKDVAPHTPYSVEGVYSGGLPFNWDGSFDTIGSKLDDSGAALTFGAVVTLAIHDYFNAHGVRATVAGESVNLKGDGHLGEGDEQRVAVAAVRASLRELDHAYELGAAGVPDEQIANEVMGPGPVVLFAAEQMLPRRTPDAALDPATDAASIRWDYPSYEELLADSRFQEAVQIFTTNKANKLTSLVSDQSDDVKNAIGKITARMRSADAPNVVREVIEWVPDTGGGLFGHNQDDNAMDYIEKAADTAGGLKSLSVSQRVRLIKDLFDGKTWQDEEDAAFAVLVANPLQITDVIYRVGRDEIEDELGKDRLQQALDLQQY